MKKTLALLLSLVMLVAVFAGCAATAPSSEAPSSEAPSSEAPSSEAPSSEAPSSEAPTGEADFSDVSIVYIPKLLNNYFTTVDKGFQKAAAELGFSYEYTGPQSGEATSQIEFLEAAIQKKVDVICISPNSNDALLSIFADAREQGIKIIVVNQELTGYEDQRDCTVFQCDFDSIGAAQVELMGELMGYEGDFAVMSAATDTPDQNYWIECMRDTLASDPKYSKMSLIDVAYGDEDPQKTTTEAEALLTKYPDLKGICAPTAVGLPICAQVVETKGLAGKIAVSGLAQPNDMRAYVKSGTVTKFQLWDPAQEGYLAGVYSVQLAKGIAGSEPGDTFSGYELGEYTINDLDQIITGPMFNFDANNIDDYDF